MLAWLVACVSTPFLSTSVGAISAGGHRPIVLWHGMGDSCCNPDSMGYLSTLLSANLNNTVFIHSVRLTATEDDDKKAGFFGIASEQVDSVCKSLAEIAELRNGFNAIGFSQGGLFLRAYVERCVEGPRVFNLITYGTVCVADAPGCEDASDTNCALMRNLIRSGAYWSWVQNRVIQAQYFKDPTNIARYLEKNIFLPYINNEIKSHRNEKYATSLKTLNKLVLIRFEDEKTVVPAESSWFGFYNDDKSEIMKIDEALLNNTIIPTYLANTVVDAASELK
ncbi:palmitoyl[protein] hydrolase [Chytriomyces confervae]|uniref:Palmitoyl-protein thioesterase 1 n=1 Tax=Chytriomyces confervae TaxID=246404 RepID=A0A507DG27_9FUNG|nr:palmitoyl[protein] hydrolase [Chytriomyces confervae]